MPSQPAQPSSAAIEVNEWNGGARLRVRVRPRSSRARVLGVREGALEVAVTAPPADGAANAELRDVLAAALDTRPSSVAIVAGASGRRKIVEVSGVSAQVVRQRLERALCAARTR